MTPISSLQNVLAVSELEAQANIIISFSSWICIAAPFCIVCTILSWCFIITFIKPDDLDHIPIVVYELKNVYSRRNTAVIILSLTTMILFAASSLKIFKEQIFGDIGIISLCYAFIMFGSGMLSEVRI